MVSSEPALLQAHIRSLGFEPNSPPVLQDIRLEIGPGEFILLLGRTGAGKSVLGRCLSGVIPGFQNGRLEGAVSLAGREAASRGLPELSTLVSLITDDPQNQLFCPTLADDLAFGPCNLGLPADSVRRRMSQALKGVGLEGFEQRRPETLSGGEAQKAALASFLTLEAPLLILDRAAGQMDAAGRKAVYAHLAGRCRDRVQSLLVIDGHFQPLLPLASRLIFLEKGSVVYDGPPGRVPAGLLESLQPPAGGPRVNASPAETATGEPSLLEVQDLSSAYPHSTFALRDISFSVHQGEFVALLGRNGAGKTTLIRHFNGLSLPDKGEVRVDGLNTREHSPAVFADRIGFLFQNPDSQLFAGTVREEVGFALRVRGVGRKEIIPRVAAILDELGLTPFAETHPYRLSRGDRQIVALAACLVNRPRLLVLDEPVSHLSYPRNWKILELIGRLNRQGLTVILVTHDFRAARHFSTRNIFLEKGRIVKDLSRPQMNPSTADRLKGLAV
ncbi:MAG: ATP-binding cassette domain-containing protein [Deltaproteobacteria bacterium]|nr:ATP-binding cassette domain-containing protein [Deltaproteobacteria bacterium]